MRTLTIERAAFIIIFALLFALATRIPIDTDTWLHIRSGEHTLMQGMIYADPFSFTMRGEPWINHSWAAQIVMCGFWQIAGNFGLAVLTSLLATGGRYMVYRMSAGHGYLRGFALVVGAATAAVVWSPGPQVSAVVLSAVVLYLLHRYKREKVDQLWLIPPVMVLWVNLHAGFSMAFILMGGMIAGEVLANLFNPQGADVIGWGRLRKLVLVVLVAAVVLVIN